MTVTTARSALKDETPVATGPRPAGPRKPPLADLEDTLGYRFVDPALAERALTHLSAPRSASDTRPDSYQRLEFLGDRVLGLAVATMLFEAFPAATEGEMSIRLAALVRRETCAEVAAEWDVGPHLRLGQGEARGGGRAKAAILGDVCEALIGAVFIEAGFEPAIALVRRFWAPRMLAGGGTARDAKTALQEWAQARALPSPRYVETGRVGPQHAPHFTIRVEVPGFEPGEGSAPSKRLAEQAAARAFIAREGRP